MGILCRFWRIQMNIDSPSNDFGCRRADILVPVPEIGNIPAQSVSDWVAGHKVSRRILPIFHCELRISARPSSSNSHLCYDHNPSDSHNICFCQLVDIHASEEVVS
ncbi:hypothetical protein SLE2022_258250 [Rubroshorea leprosula]